MSRCAARTRPATASSRAISAGSRASGRSDQRVVEGAAAALRAGGGVVAQQRRGVGDEVARLLGIRQQDPDNGFDRHIVVARMPAVVVGDHGDGGVTELGLAGEFRLRHVGHADHVAAPGSVEFGLGEGGELRPLHRQIDAAADGGNAGGFGGAHQAVAEPAADGARHRHMGDEAAVEKLFSRAKVRSMNWSTRTKVPGVSASRSEPTALIENRLAAADAFEGVDIGRGSLSARAAGGGRGRDAAGIREAGRRERRAAADPTARPRGVSTVSQRRSSRPARSSTPLPPTTPMARFVMRRALAIPGPAIRRRKPASNRAG